MKSGSASSTELKSQLVEEGAIVALATDLQPGSSPLRVAALVMNLAGVVRKDSDDEFDTLEAGGTETTRVDGVGTGCKV